MVAPWWTFNRIDNFGTIDPQGNYYKPDSNIQIPGDYPVVAILPGTVTSVQRTTFGQTVVTMRLDTPRNSLATHDFYEHLSVASVSVGEHLNAGQLVGNNNPAGQVPLGFGFYSGDVYGSGSAWTVLQHDLCPGCANLLNPVSFLDSARANPGNFPTSTDGGSSSSTGNPLDPLTGLISQLGGLWAWLQNPMRLVKMIVGVAFIALALYMLIVPEAAQKVGNFVKNNPEILAA